MTTLNVVQWLRFATVTTLIGTTLYILIKQNHKVSTLRESIYQIMLKMNTLIVYLSNSIEEGSINDRIRAEMAESTIISIIQLSSDPILSKNVKNEIITWNRAAEKIFGYRFDEIIGKSITILVPIELVGEEAVIFEHFEKGEKIEDMKTIRVTKDGARLNVVMTITPIRNKIGTVIGASQIIKVI